MYRLPHTPRTRILWLAMLAILWGVMAPSLTSGLARSTGTVWIEVCTSMGTQRIAVNDDDPSPSTENSRRAMSDCGYCRFQHHLPPIDPASHSGMLVSLPADDALPPAGGGRIPARHNWPAHFSRGPPARA
ncbi:DUF2946 domain-containing protein [Roseateles sp. SL47]|uniref:DUF2946 domain-containing protein n=1 Tax=Roseateles sp. SL47 TaxID=2995138 RepID=UPI003B640D9C